MKQPDPSRFTGKKEQKADELEMRGFSSTPLGEPVAPVKKVEVKQGATIETVQPTNQDTTVSRYQDTMIADIRKAVKEFGKEAATHRFTDKEKQALAEVIFKYKKVGLKTSENEITRIAINYIIKDYLQNGDKSLLEKVLKALNE
jgi:hypothetical protein